MNRTAKATSIEGMSFKGCLLQALEYKGQLMLRREVFDSCTSREHEILLRTIFELVLVVSERNAARLAAPELCLAQRRLSSPCMKRLGDQKLSPPNLRSCLNPFQTIYMLRFDLNRCFESQREGKSGSQGASEAVAVAMVKGQVMTLPCGRPCTEVDERVVICGVVRSMILQCCHRIFAVIRVCEVWFVCAARFVIAICRLTHRLSSNRSRGDAWWRPISDAEKGLLLRLLGCVDGGGS
jgi:hypothetical protein